MPGAFPRGVTSRVVKREAASRRPVAATLPLPRRLPSASTAAGISDFRPGVQSPRPPPTSAAPASRRDVSSPGRCGSSRTRSTTPVEEEVSLTDTGTALALKICWMGPNPLSCKKKKPKLPAAIQNQAAKADGEAKRKRVRKRKRGQKDNKQLESAN